jgi:ppGpp synthetase/RelA/SpoT-type nucleotidyltranferase
LASLDFELEKRAFYKFYDGNRARLNSVKNGYMRMISQLLKAAEVGEVTAVEGRVKDREECVKKFHRKYQSKLEAAGQPYEIRNYLTDLIGIRIICPYEDQIVPVAEVLKRHFRIIDVTDKISALESTEDSFGYKGLHMDLALPEARAALPKFAAYADLPFEVQIRSLIQDAWSVLDHKIKYKKSIPNELKRRINVLSALFELADREFKEIRNATEELIQKARVEPIGEPTGSNGGGAGETAGAASEKTANAFNFMRIARHFFRDFEFEDFKVDGFVEDILKLDHNFKKSDLHRSLIEHLKTVRDYREAYLAENAERTFSPYTSIRHCLYLYNRETFARILSPGARERFEAWLRRAEG